MRKIRANGLKKVSEYWRNRDKEPGQTAVLRIGSRRHAGQEKMGIPVFAARCVSDVAKLNFPGLCVNPKSDLPTRFALGSTEM